MNLFTGLNILEKFANAPTTSSSNVFDIVTYEIMALSSLGNAMVGAMALAKETVEEVNEIIHTRKLKV